MSENENVESPQAPKKKGAERVVKPPKRHKVYLIANCHVNLEVIKNLGGAINFDALRRIGGSRVERGTRITVWTDVAERLLALSHESYEKGQHGVYVPSFTLDKKVPENK